MGLLDWIPDLDHIEYHFFEQLSTWDYFAPSSYVLLATLGILLNLRALMVVIRNKNLSTTIKSYLFADHLCRIISDLILYYPAGCPFIRIADLDCYFPTFSFESTPEFIASNRTYTPICVVAPWISVWGAEANQVLSVAFNTIMHFLELLQFAISLNRWLAVSFGGRHHHVLAKTKHLQIDLMLTVTMVAFYKYSFGNFMYFDDFSYSLVSTEYQGYTALSAQLLKAIRIMAVLITFFSILLDWATYVLLKKHLEQSRQLTQSDAKIGADMRLAKQLLFNHSYSIFVAACNCYMLIVFSSVDNLAPNVAERDEEVGRNIVIVKTSWFIFLASTLFPALGTVVNGLMTIIFLSPRKENTTLTNSGSFLTGTERLSATK